MNRALLDSIAGSALSTRETLYSTYWFTRRVLEEGIPGDLVECGVYAGAQIAAMYQAWSDSFEAMRETATGVERRIHLFDSFTGIPQCGKHDEEFQASGKQPGESTCSRLDVENNLRRWGVPDWMLVWHEGLFADTVPYCNNDNWALFGIPPLKQIALLRLDGDLYESTRDCMPLIDLVSPGGWIICDDYHLSGCRKAIHEKVIPSPVYWQPHGSTA